MWSKYGIAIQLDITTYCNARCPQCHRNNDNGLNEVSWLPKYHWTLDDFKKAFPPEVLENVRSINFCPTWGDPCMNIDLPDMIKYAKKINRGMHVSVNTNGSMQTEEWWFNLSSIRDLSVTFAVDGPTQEIHEVYRRGTNLSKVLANMEIFSAGLGQARVDTILFKHNEPYVEEIRKMVYDHGAVAHTLIPSVRFDPWNGLPEYEQSYSTNTYYDKQLDEYVTLELYESTDLSKGTVARTSKNQDEFKENEIFCIWGNNNDVSIAFDGTVFPCCYVSNPFLRHGKSNDNRWFTRHPVLQNYKNNESDYNIFNNSLNDIMDMPIFKSILPKSWESENPLAQCQKHCTRTERLHNRLTIIATDND